MGEPAIDAPRTVDQLAWWVGHGEEQRLEIERLRAELDWWQQSFVCRFGPNNLGSSADSRLALRAATISWTSSEPSGDSGRTRRSLKRDP